MPNFPAATSRDAGSELSVKAKTFSCRPTTTEPIGTRSTLAIFGTPSTPISCNGFPGARFSHGNELQTVSGLTFDPPQRTDRLYTAFVQDEIEIVPQRLSLTVGTKLLKTNYTGAEFEPSARLLYTPTATQTLWAAFTRAVRTPSDIERDLNISAFLGTLPGGLPFFARFNANRDFRSERMLGYEVGYRRLITSKIYFDLAGFFNQ